MDLSPPALSQSPSSPSNTYCPSERSSLDYPSPDLVAQHYKLSPIYGAEPTCLLPSSLDAETSLPPMDAMGQPQDWNHTVIHPFSSASAMPNIMSGDYGVHHSYDSPVPHSPYAHDVYSAQTVHASPVLHSATPPPTGAAPRSPIPTAPRTPLSFPTSVPLPGSMTPRMVKMEGQNEFGQPLDVLHYPSPRSVHSVPASYGTENGPYGSPAPSYMSDDGSSSWQKPSYQASASEPFYGTSDGGPTSHAAFMQDARRAYRVQRPRRAPRRLTTKEEANFQCDVKGCGKLFSRSYNFKAHMETHDEKREYPFPCMLKDCNKKFVRKTDLQRHHSSVHAKERNHKCDYCGRLFARKDTLRRHMEDGCSKRFDIGTLDLRADSYDSMTPSSARPLSTPIMSQPIVCPPAGLPRMAIPPLGSTGIMSPLPSSIRGRDILASGDHTQGHSWGR